MTPSPQVKEGFALHENYAKYGFLYVRLGGRVRISS